MTIITARSLSPMFPWTAVANCLRKAFDYKGRARRAEYWWYTLFLTLDYGAADILDKTIPIDNATDFQISLILFAWLAYLVLMVPWFAVAVRRLHDTEHSGWLILIGFIPLVGLWLLWPLCKQGTTGDNRFGPDPFRRDQWPRR